MSKDKAILVVSFGTSHEGTRKKTIGAIEERVRQAYPDWEVRRAFTSGMIMKVLKKRDGIHIDNVAEAMEKLKQDGCKEIFIQPTHIINGDEYEKMLDQALPYLEQGIDIKVGAPLLTASRDYEDVCHAILKSFSNSEGLVLMGHGTGHYADSAYAALDYRFKTLGFETVFVGTVEGYPELDDVLKMTEKQNLKKITLLPLMVVAGDHAVNDMAGDDEDSWKTAFAEAGYDVTCVLKGLGEFAEIQDIYLRHIADGMENG